MPTDWSNREGCRPITEWYDVPGAGENSDVNRIALLMREDRSCYFTTKVKHAQDAGSVQFSNETKI